MGGGGWRGHPRRAGAAAADGAFLADPLSQSVKARCAEPPHGSQRFHPMTMKPLMAASFALMLANAAHAQAPASPATPPAQTAPPAASQPTNCAPMTPNGTG